MLSLWEKKFQHYYVIDLQISIGYFIADLGMIFWKYPSLGGIEYVSNCSWPNPFLRRYAVSSFPNIWPVYVSLSVDLLVNLYQGKQSPTCKTN